MPTRRQSSLKNLFLICLAALVVVGRAGLCADPLLDEPKVQLHRLFEACRTRTLLTGSFPKNFRDLEGFLSASFQRRLPQDVEFGGPEWPEYRRSMSSPVGLRTPCLRLQVGKDRWLNVAMTGWVYESGQFWQSEFVDLMPLPFMHPTLLKKDHRAIPERVIARPPECGPRQLDLAKRCNALPTGPWILAPTIETEPPGFASWFASGFYEYQDVLFDVRGVIQVDGLVTTEGTGVRNFPAYPKAVTDIPVNQQVTTLHLLAGTVDRAPAQSAIATLRLRFKSGETEDLPLRYGVDLTAADDPLPIPGRLYPRGESPPGYYSLHYVQFVSPRAGEEVTSFDFISGNTPSQPFLLAVTITP